MLALVLSFIFILPTSNFQHVASFWYACLYSWSRQLLAIRLHVASEVDKQRMRELRTQGLSLDEIVKQTGFSAGTVSRFTNDILFKVGHYKKELPIRMMQGTIIDIETTGLDYREHEIITFGYLEGNTARVLQRAEATPDEYHYMISESLRKLPQPFYGYNSEFDRMFLISKTGVDFAMVDLFESFKKKSDDIGKKYPKLDELPSVPREYFGEKTVPARMIPSLWNSYLAKKDKRALAAIVRHNMEDLRQIMALMAYFLSEDL